MAIDQGFINCGLRFDVVPISGSGGLPGTGVPACGSRSTISGEACESGGIIAASKAMREILDVMRRSAPTDAPVLIYGEPDTGKNLIAREVHRQSRRQAKAFVHVVCGALRESDLAEKLFGRASTSQSVTTKRRGRSWRKPGEEPSSWKTLCNCPFGPRSGSWRFSSRGRFPRRRTSGRRGRRAGDRVQRREPVRCHGATGLSVELVLLPQGHRDPRSAVAASLPRYLSAGGTIPGGGQRRAGEPRQPAPMPLCQRGIAVPRRIRLAWQQAAIGEYRRPCGPVDRRRRDHADASQGIARNSHPA